MARSDNNWTNEIELIIKQWGELADELDNKYDSQAKRQKIYHYALMIPMILAQGISGGLAIYNIISDELGVKITLVILSIISGIALSLAALFKFDASSQASDNISAKYSRLCNKLETELQKERKHREDGLVFVEYARRKYGRLAEISPDLTGDIKKIFFNWHIGNKKKEPNKINIGKEINIAKDGETYATDGAIAEAAKISEADKAIIDQFIEDNIV